MTWEYYILAVASVTPPPLWPGALVVCIRRKVSDAVEVEAGVR